MVRLLSVGLVVLSLAAHAAEPSPAAAETHVGEAVLIGAFGLAAAGGYTLGAYLTGDQRSGFVLATLGGVTSGAALGTWIGLAINKSRKQPGSLVGFILLPLLSGLAGAVVGGLAAGFASDQPGSGRTATHAVIIGLLLTDAIVAEITLFSR